MKYLARVLKYIRKLNLTAIGTTALSGFGWLGRIAGAFVMKALEIFIDGEIKKAEENIAQRESDKDLEEKAKQNADKIINATTDDELDNAFRDSLK